MKEKAIMSLRRGRRGAEEDEAMHCSANARQKDTAADRYTQWMTVPTTATVDLIDPCHCEQ